MGSQGTNLVEPSQRGESATTLAISPLACPMHEMNFTLALALSKNENQLETKG